MWIDIPDLKNRKIKRKKEKSKFTTSVNNGHVFLLHIPSKMGFTVKSDEIAQQLSKFTFLFL